MLLRRWSAFLSILALAACVAVPVDRATLQPLAVQGPDVRVERDAVVHLSTGRNRRIAQGTRWRPVGTLPQGTVYQPVDSVFIIAGRQIHEAYLVVRDGALQGFYLPGESNFSPLSPSLSLHLGATR